MTIVQHLEELRRVLIISLIAWVSCTVLAFAFHTWLLAVLLHPLLMTLQSGNHFIKTAIFTSPTEALTIPLQLAAFAGIILALPVILWQIWTFIAPGLRPQERKFAGPFIASALVLFAIGATFAYFVMPIGLNFLVTFLGSDVEYFPDINQYLSFLLLLILIFGVTFELPVVIVLLGVMRIVSSRWLRDRRKGLWVTIIAAAIVVTPGADPFTPTLLAVPLIILFELSTLILAKVFRR